MIRKFHTNDTDQIMNLWLEENQRNHHFIPHSYWKSQYQEVKNSLPKANIFLYEKNHIIYGFVGVIDNYIAGIFVKKDYQSQRIGFFLIDFLKKNYSFLQLNVYQKNIRAISFYRRENFIISKESIDISNQEKEFVMEWKKTNLP